MTLIRDVQLYLVVLHALREPGDRFLGPLYVFPSWDAGFPAWC